MIEKVKNIFIIGIKGVAMTNLAVILKKMGKSVTGCDIEEEFITDELLKKHSISYSADFHPQNLPEKTDLVVYSAAHGGIKNSIAIEAKKRKIPVISQAEVLGEVMKQFKTTIAVSGCHGKTTTSSLLSYALIQLSVKPSYLVGAPSFNTYDGADYNENTYFVVEADEYGINPPQNIRPKFHFLNPDYIICTNIDFDHPDVFTNLQDTKKAFLKFFNNKKLVVCADDPCLQDLHQSYGFSKNADYVISDVKTNIDGTTFKLTDSKKSRITTQYTISLFGDKNVSNAAAAIVTLLMLGFSGEKIQKAIKGFTGAKRRFEKVFGNTSYSLYDDYGHHPHEIEATISAARKRFLNRRFVVIFQPHTYSRTQMFLKEFANALSLADYSFILPIFASAREDKLKFSITSEDIIKAGAKNSESVHTSDELVLKLRLYLKKNDILFTMGAGDVYKLKDKIIPLL